MPRVIRENKIINVIGLRYRIIFNLNKKECDVYSVKKDNKIISFSISTVIDTLKKRGKTTNIKFENIIEGDNVEIKFTSISNIWGKKRTYL